MMITRIVLEVLAALGAIVLGDLFWMHPKRKRMIRTILDDYRLLERVVTAELLENPPPQFQGYLRPRDAGYRVNMLAFVSADQTAQRRPRPDGAAQRRPRNRRARRDHPRHRTAGIPARRRPRRGDHHRGTVVARR